MESIHYFRTLVVMGNLLILPAVPVRAGLIACEEFDDYQINGAAPMNGGTGWGEAWKHADGITDAVLKLLPGNLDPLGGSAKGIHVATSENITLRKLSQEAATNIAASSAANGEIWISFTAQQPRGAWGSVTLWNADCLNFTDDSENYNVVIGRNPFDGGDWSWSDITSVGVSSTGTVPATTAVRFVMRFEYREGLTVATMYLFTTASQVADTLEKSNPATTATARIEDVSGNRPVFDRIRISGHLGMVMDSIRIGTTFADVFPKWPWPPPECGSRTSDWRGVHPPSLHFGAATVPPGMSSREKSFIRALLGRAE